MPVQETNPHYYRDLHPSFSNWALNGTLCCGKLVKRRRAEKWVRRTVKMGINAGNEAF